MKHLSIALLAASVLFISGCEELENLCGISSDDLGFTEDYTKQLNAAIYIYQQSDRAMRDSTLKADGTAEIDGATCTRTQDSVVVNFGNGVVGNDGKVRRGSYRIAYSGDYTSAGSSASIKLLNYFEDDVAFTGNVGLNNTSQGGTPAIAVNVAKLTSAEKELNGTVSATWLSGFETESLADDDVFELAGSLALEDLNNSNLYTGQITNPLRVAYNCSYTLESGALALTTNIQDFPDITLDFIDGDCSNLFQATIDCEGNSLQFFYPIK